MSGHAVRPGLLRPFRRAAAWSAALGAAACLSLCPGLTGRAGAASSTSAAPVASPTSYPSPAQAEAAEKRLAAIAAELRCLVCQNESLAGSQADLAKDLRREILGMIEAGSSDGEIIDFMVSRYGDFVRYRPPFRPSTCLLWSGPFLLLAGGLGGLLMALRRQGRRAEAPPLSAEEKQRAERLLAGEEAREP